MTSLMGNPELKSIFLSSGALEYWDDCANQFLEAWDCQTVKAAYDKLLEWKRKQDPSSDIRNESIQLPSFDIPSENHGKEPAKQQDLEGKLFQRS